ncbi:hypothetical protein [Caballeronia sp. LZ034LL]|uniref:hypothetical protein n=1 Tax=Caballeronia sp. LZ034LL TaxID=3038567 RepID=UPI00286AFD83|nr:hypothetical protein [Caballeronia sp. LZ034LL]
MMLHGKGPWRFGISCRREVGLLEGKPDGSRLKNNVQAFDPTLFIKLHRIDAANVQELDDPGKSAFSLQFSEAFADKNQVKPDRMGLGATTELQLMNSNQFRI